jgi:hypothetical protein
MVKKSIAMASAMSRTDGGAPDEPGSGGDPAENNSADDGKNSFRKWFAEMQHKVGYH